MGVGRLEEKLRNLIDQHEALIQEKLEMGRLIDVQAGEIEDLETTIGELRARIDELDGNRFALKKLEDERKTIKRKLEGALGRLEDLEKEL